MTTTHKVLLIVGGALLGIGLLIGLLPVSADGASCGSALVASDDAVVSALAGLGSFGAAEACDSLRSLLMIPAVVLMVAGGVTVIATLVARSQAIARQGQQASV